MKFFFSKYFFLILLFLVALILIPMFLYSTTPSAKRGPGIIPPVVPPLPIFRQVAPTAIPTPVLEITQIAPADKTTNVALNDPVAIEFSRTVSPGEKVQIRLTLTPTASGEAKWSPDNSQLFFVPSMLFSPQTSYSATILFQDKSYSWTFTTGSQESTTGTTQQQARTTQASYDDQWAQMQQKLYQNYPWYDQLPLSTSNYFVSFDISQNILTADLFPKDPTNTTEINKIKQDVEDALKKIGVDLTKVSIQWQISQ